MDGEDSAVDWRLIDDGAHSLFINIKPALCLFVVVTAVLYLVTLLCNGFIKSCPSDFSELQDIPLVSSKQFYLYTRIQSAYILRPKDDIALGKSDG